VSFPNHKTSIFCFSLVLFTVAGCCEDEEEIDYSFFVAGHAYGGPEGYVGGFYKPFVNQFEFMNTDSTLSFGVFTGDVVKHDQRKFWDLVQRDVQKIEMPVHLAPGNHDAKDNEFYHRHIGKRYYSFGREGDLFLILDANDGWNISGAQLDFVKKAVAEHEAGSGNIFVFTHQLIWREHPRYRKIGMNSPTGQAGELSFWDEVAPLFLDLECKTYFFAGDVGAFDWATSVFHDEIKNLSFIASGMGGGRLDNYIIVDVLKSKDVKFRLISLDSDKFLGALEDY